MKAQIVVLLTLGLINGAFLDPVTYFDCGSEYRLEGVNIERCNKTDCIFHNNDNRNIDISLYGRIFKSQKLRQDVYLLFNTIQVPLKVVPIDLCALVTCPVQINQNASFSATMDFTNMPAVQSAVTLVWQIYSETNEVVMCMRVRAKYEKPK